MTVQDVHPALLEDSYEIEQGAQTEESQAAFSRQIDDLMPRLLERVVARPPAAHVDEHDVEPALVQTQNQIADGGRRSAVSWP